MTAGAGEQCAPDDGSTRGENTPIKEAYVKLSTIQWQWGEVLSSWQVSKSLLFTCVD
jgi:hypothetical protein